MQIAKIVANASIYGPANRFVIWLQGCSLHCKGCWNKEMWAFDKGQKYSVAELMQLIFNTPDIEGITLLGGEPLDQYAETLALCQAAQAQNLSVMLFTGYEMAEISDKNYTPLLDFVDILLTGRYDEQQRNTDLQWIGSNNQQIHFLTDRYANHPIQNANYVEIQIDPQGQLQFMGFPQLAQWQDFL